MQMQEKGKSGTAKNLRGELRLRVLCLTVLGAGMAMTSTMSGAWSGQAAQAKSSPANGTDKSVSDKAASAASAGNGAAQNKSEEDGLVIEPAELAPTYPHGTYQVKFHARGNYVPVLHWKLLSGTLPRGITLEDDGLLHGEAQRAGEFQFVVGVRDGGQPQQAWQKGFTIKVVEAITVAWKVPAHVNANRIEGSVEVSNTTADDMDLTFDVKAVAENGRATEIGYQRFPLKRGTIGMALPFGESLPFGGYVIHVNVVGEVAKRNAIYRQQMQTPAPLQVLVGP
jgi:hypothetical protein